MCSQKVNILSIKIKCVKLIHLHFLKLLTHKIDTLCGLTEVVEMKGNLGDIRTILGFVGQSKPVRHKLLCIWTFKDNHDGLMR
jgi:hypothetical protein